VFAATHNVTAQDSASLWQIFFADFGAKMKEMTFGGMLL
jgi:hypothetical protein